MKSLLFSRAQELKLSELRQKIKPLISEKRYEHTLFVEKTAYKLASEIIPERIYDLCIAAILHDVTKELSKDEHINIIESDFIELTDEDKSTEGILHSFSAPGFCKRNFSEYVNNDVLSAIKNHTVGSPFMSVFDKIVFISDYIEESRKYKSCIDTRNWLLSEISKADSYNKKIYSLNKACLMAILATESSLLDKGARLNSRMLLTKDSLIKELDG